MLNYITVIYITDLFLKRIFQC